MKMTLAQARQKAFGIRGQNAFPARGQKMDGIAGDQHHFREHGAQRFVDGAKKIGQAGAEIILRTAELKRENSGIGEPPGGLREELERVEAVQLGRLGVGQVDDDDVVAEASALEEPAAIGDVNPHARIGYDGFPELGEVEASQFQHRRIEFHVIDVLDAGMLKRLREASINAAADEQRVAWRGVREQRVMHRLFGRGGVGRGEQHQSVLVQAAAATVIHHRQVAVGGVAHCEELEAAPGARHRSGIQARKGQGQPRPQAQCGR